MRHRKLTRKLGRQYSHRKATLKNLIRALFLHQRIKTTRAKAKEVARLVDKLITIAKKDTLSARRKAYILLNDKDLVSLLFRQIACRFDVRKGGYTRILHLENRRGDNAEMAVLELTEQRPKEPPKPKEIKKKPAKEKLPEEKLPSEKPPLTPEKKIPPKRPPKEKLPKRFLGGLRKLFRRERDSL